MSRPAVALVDVRDGFSLDYDVVRDELKAQINRLGDDQFPSFANEALIELEERYGVTTPIEDRVQELTDRYYRGIEVVHALDFPKTVNELADELEPDTGEVHDRIAYLATIDRVHRDGDTVRPVESSGRHPYNGTGLGRSGSSFGGFIPLGWP